MDHSLTVTSNSFSSCELVNKALNTQTVCPPENGYSHLTGQRTRIGDRRCKSWGGNLLCEPPPGEYKCVLIKPPKLSVLIYCDLSVEDIQVVQVGPKSLFPLFLLLLRFLLLHAGLLHLIFINCT